MAGLNEMIASGVVCQCLRTKTMFYQAEPGLEAEGGEEGGPFWCARTQSLLGPDGQIADTENCRPGRSCCETA